MSREPGGSVLLDEDLDDLAQVFCGAQPYREPDPLVLADPHEESIGLMGIAVRYCKRRPLSLDRIAARLRFGSELAQSLISDTI